VHKFTPGADCATQLDSHRMLFKLHNESEENCIQLVGFGTRTYFAN